MLRPYRLLAAVPWAPSLMIFGLLGRLHLPAIPIVMTFLIADWTGAYLTGGVIGGMLLVGQAVAGPVRGRAADRGSRPRLLLVTALLHSSGLATMAVLAHPSVLPASLWWVLLPIATVTGLCQPPVSQIAKAIWPEIVSGSARDAAYAVEATLQELLFVAGPLLAAFTVAFAGPVVATVACAVVAVVGSAVFAFVLARAGVAGALCGTGAQPSRMTYGLLVTPGLPLILAFGALVAAGLFTTDLVLVGWARNQKSPELAGVLAAVWAIGSLTGGLVMGASSRTPKLWLRGVASAVGLLALVPALPPIADRGSPWIVGVILFIGGVAIAPTLAACNGILAELVSPDRRSEAFGWFATATLAGATAAAPIAGGLLDTGGPGIAAGVAGTLTMVGALLVVRHPARTSQSAPAG